VLEEFVANCVMDAERQYAERSLRRTDPASEYDWEAAVEESRRRLADATNPATHEILSFCPPALLPMAERLIRRGADRETARAALLAEHRLRHPEFARWAAEDAPAEAAAAAAARAPSDDELARALNEGTSYAGRAAGGASAESPETRDAAPALTNRDLAASLNGGDYGAWDPTMDEDPAEFAKRVEGERLADAINGNLNSTARFRSNVA
jgi:hypothetical protein